MDLNGTSAIVTGGASGLGLATSRLLAERGVRVVVADLQEDKGVPLAKEIGGLFVQTDVTNAEQVIAAVDAAVEMAPLKSLVNCAGIGWATRTIGRDGDYASAHDLDLYRRVIEINLIGTFNCIRLAATKMSLNEPDEDGARGAIVNTSSVAAEDGQIGQAAYSSSKGGVVGMTLPVARDLAVVGIRVNTILPGLIDTPIYGAGEGVRDVQGEAGAGRALPAPPGLLDGVRLAGARAAVQLVHQRRVDPHRRRHPDAAEVVARPDGGGTVDDRPGAGGHGRPAAQDRPDRPGGGAARPSRRSSSPSGSTSPGSRRSTSRTAWCPDGRAIPTCRCGSTARRGAVGDGRVPGILMIHGGGFVIGSVEAEHAGAALTAIGTGAVVVSVDYRLAPEHPYPAGLHDCYAALTLPARRGRRAGRRPRAGGPERVPAPGAGWRRRRRSSPATGAARRSASSCCRSPSSTTGSRPAPCRRSWTRPCGTGRWPCRAGRPISGRCYGTADVPAYAAPARADDLSGLPPAYVSTAENDPLRDEGITYAQRLLQAGVSVELHQFPGTFHGSALVTTAAVSKRAAARVGAGAAAGARRRAG